jgi:hypothetical protein
MTSADLIARLDEGPNATLMAHVPTYLAALLDVAEAAKLLADSCDFEPGSFVHKTYSVAMLRNVLAALAALDSLVEP